MERPQALCDRILRECAEDQIDILIALGILKVDAQMPQETGQLTSAVGSPLTD
jgi:hypothetical protein